MPPSTSIRKLIEQALEEAREEFAEIVKRKLEALMGDGEAAPRRAPKPARPEGRRARRPAAAPDEPSRGRRSRAPEAHMAELRSRVLSAMPMGEPLKRARIIELARVSDEDEPRVAAVLRKLKDEGILQMRGTKASAVYTRKG
ncbi:MAG: hypothetical protein HYV09_33780 [Deltaproteobacteria bacterium]|nr:hypothetical protein [Deltaproteobacteria bacterium]